MIANLTGMQLDAYKLLRRLGGGTFGDVYEATDLRRNERVAVKVMEPLKTTEDMETLKLPLPGPLMANSSPQAERVA